MQNVDGIVTTSQKMKDLIMKHIGRNSIIIPDPVEHKEKNLELH
ncbi:MAG: hypothetical protein CM15mV8_1810 [Caudoviricetes sp.]|nr:MAG: hypothetical protein CM15mV8_1810 [Caudoviricetes sp.]